MSEVVYTGAVANIGPVVATFPADSDTLMILEALPDHWIEVKHHQPDSGLIFTRFDEQENFETWGRGRIFNPNAELRWERTDGDFQVVYIGPPVELSGLIADYTLNLAETDQRDSGYYLWGQRMDKTQLEDMRWEDPTATDIFVELQTPRVLRYPAQVQAGSRLKLQTTGYYDKQTDQLLLYRLKGVEAA